MRQLKRSGLLFLFLHWRVHDLAGERLQGRPRWLAQELLLFERLSLLLVHGPEHGFQLPELCVANRDLLLELLELLYSGVDDPGRQVEALGHLEQVDLLAQRLQEHQLARALLPVCLVAAVVLDLDVQVHAALTAVPLLAVVVGALRALLDFVRAPPIVLLAPIVRVALLVASGLLALEAQLQDFLENLVPFAGFPGDLLYLVLVG